MIYVFDNDEDMVSCCGCPLSPQKLLSLSVEKNLIRNAFTSSTLADQGPTIGIIDVISVLPNTASVKSFA
jgi:hypothetical protein